MWAQDCVTHPSVSERVRLILMRIQPIGAIYSSTSLESEREKHNSIHRGLQKSSYSLISNAFQKFQKIGVPLKKFAKKNIFSY